MARRGYHKTVDLLEQVSSDPADLSSHLGSLPIEQMDSVWVGAVVSVLAEAYPSEPVAHIARVLRVVREKYRDAGAPHASDWIGNGLVFRKEATRKAIEAAMSEAVPNKGDVAVLMDVFGKGRGRKVCIAWEIAAKDPRFERLIVRRNNQNVKAIRRIAV